jgi:hypothetical protein
VACALPGAFRISQQFMHRLSAGSPGSPSHHQDRHDRVEAQPTARHARRTGPLFDFDFPEKAPHPDFKNFDKASPLLFDFCEQSVAQALSKRRLDRSYLCPTISAARSNRP